MTENLLARLLEHNNWANEQIIQICATLSDAQLDAEPAGAALGSIRETLFHLVGAQQNYFSLLTLPVEARQKAAPSFDELQTLARSSGESLLALTQDPQNEHLNKAQVKTTDGYHVAPWVVMLQVINHATEHREQIKSMLTALDVTPPSIDGWDYGDVTGALVQITD
jgi:uncharacterized damage-inducible protein DinB